VPTALQYPGADPSDDGLKSAATKRFIATRLVGLASHYQNQSTLPLGAA
jgi:hypothetical protein